VHIENESRPATVSAPRTAAAPTRARWVWEERRMRSNAAPINGAAAAVL
jgi:hypothetical protein